jgi:hypothetical protein
VDALFTAVAHRLEVSIVKRPTIGLFVAALLAFAPQGTVSAATVSGYRDIQNWAQVGFEQVPPEVDCIAVYPTVTFVAGDHLAAIGAGKPGPWSDVTVNLTIYDACADGPPLLSLDGFIPVTNPEMISMESASLTGVVVNLSDSSGANTISAIVNLAWDGNDDPERRITQGSGDGYRRVDTVVTAAVSGTLEFTGGNVSWDGLRIFTADDAAYAEMGHAFEIAMSRS